MYINWCWCGPLQVIIAMFLLYQELGASMFAGFAILIIIMPLNAIFASFLKKLQTKQMEYKDERVKIINEILNGIKVIKLYAWELSFMNRIFNIRNKEIKKVFQIAYFDCVLEFVWTIAPFLVSFVTFAIYVLSDDKHILDAQKAFVSLTLFNLLRYPLSMLPTLFSNVVMVNIKIC